MIPNQWYAVLESSEVPRGRPVRVRRLGEELVFWRNDEGRLACLKDTCPHRGAALSQGKLVGDHVQCPFHGFEFAADGRCRHVPANGRAAPEPRQIRAASYPAAEVSGLVFIRWGDAEPDPPAPRFFDDLDGLPYATSRDPWNAHYSRVIENQLDVAHLPFVHHNTIGRGGRTLVDGPLLEWRDEDRYRFRLYVFNRVDDGRPPRRAEELSPPDGPFWLEFIFPNLWQNHIGPKTRVFAAFVPVDDERTQLYLRFYHGFTRLPLLGAMLARLAMPSNLYIAHQDRRVVETQSPKRSELKSGEKLVPADRPIVVYRQRRQELIDAGAGDLRHPVPGRR